MQSVGGRNNSGLDDLVPRQSAITSAQAEPAMSNRINESSEHIDHATSRSICRGVGERLQRDLRPERSELPSHLRHLMHELQRQDRRDN
jgi:hypothetical protein